MSAFYSKFFFFFFKFLVKFKVLQFNLPTSHSKEEAIKQNLHTHYTLIISYLYRVCKVTEVNLNFPKGFAVSY